MPGILLFTAAPSLLHRTIPGRTHLRRSRPAPGTGQEGDSAVAGLVHSPPAFQK